MIIISTSLTKPGQPSPRFHVEAWLSFRNCEMVYWTLKQFLSFFLYFSFYILLSPAVYFSLSKKPSTLYSDNPPHNYVQTLYRDQNLQNVRFVSPNLVTAPGPGPKKTNAHFTVFVKIGIESSWTVRQIMKHGRGGWVVLRQLNIKHE